MQIKLENVSFKNLKNLTFTLNDKKITGIVSSDIKDLINLNYIISNNIKDEGNIKYTPRFSKKSIGVISISKLDDMINGKVIDYIHSNIDDSLFEILDLNKSILEKNIKILSNTEKVKILFLKTLSENYETILINGIFEELDSSLRKKFIKIILNLKKFNNKTIIVSSTDVDIIYEFIDDLILIINSQSLTCDNKFSIYDDKEIVNNPQIRKPFVKQIEDMVYNKSNISLGKNDTINELIKAIYREIR